MNFYPELFKCVKEFRVFKSNHLHLYFISFSICTYAPRLALPKVKLRYPKSCLSIRHNLRKKGRRSKWFANLVFELYHNLLIQIQHSQNKLLRSKRKVKDFKHQTLEKRGILKWKVNKIEPKRKNKNDYTFHFHNTILWLVIGIVIFFRLDNRSGRYIFLKYTH